MRKNEIIQAHLNVGKSISENSSVPPQLIRSTFSSNLRYKTGEVDF